MIKRLRADLSTPVADQFTVGYGLVLDFVKAQDLVCDLNKIIAKAEPRWKDPLQRFRNFALRCNTDDIELVQRSD